MSIQISIQVISIQGSILRAFGKGSGLKYGQCLTMSRGSRAKLSGAANCTLRLCTFYPTGGVGPEQGTAGGDFQRTLRPCALTC
eukprot:366372-Chlamydomonas_euryale.AAC.10